REVVLQPDVQFPISIHPKRPSERSLHPQRAAQARTVVQLTRRDTHNWKPVAGFASCPVLLAGDLSGLHYKAAAVRLPPCWFWVLAFASQRQKPLSARWKSGNLAPSARFPREGGSR